MKHFEVGNFLKDEKPPKPNFALFIIALVVLGIVILFLWFSLNHLGLLLNR